MTTEREFENGMRMAAMAVTAERTSGYARGLPTWSLVGVVVDHMSPLVCADDARRMKRAGTVSVGCVVYPAMTDAVMANMREAADRYPMPPGDGECVCVVSLGGETRFGVMPCDGSEGAR